jgi:hypothetical protein
MHTRIDDVGWLGTLDTCEPPPANRDTTFHHNTAATHHTKNTTTHTHTHTHNAKTGMNIDASSTRRGGTA